MSNAFLISTDRVFSNKIKKILPHNLTSICRNIRSNGNQINKALTSDADLVFMDFSYIHYLKNVIPKAKIIIASHKYDLKKEYLSARLGAKGFITKNIEAQHLKKAITAVNSGQIWMTRSVVTLVFKEYSRILNEK